MKSKIIVTVMLTVLIIGGLFWLWHRSETKRIELYYEQKIRKLQPQIVAQSKTEYYFKVYGLDYNTNEIIVNFYVDIQEELSLIEKLKILANKLSEFVFNYHPIDVLRIENRNGQRIAIIELRESNSPGAFTWSGGYFQGSSGGMSTTVTLRCTFLQVGYPGEWVDGVEFYYEGQPISKDWEHIGLSGTIYRK